MPSGNLTTCSSRSIGACLLVLLICAGRLAAQEISLDLGGGVKMEFVWVPVGGPDGTASIQIGDFSGTNVKEPLHTESIFGPFQQAGGGFGYYLGKAEVTETQWVIVTGQGKKSQLPTTGKTYLEIQSFIDVINSKSGQSATFPRTDDGSPGVIRLPTEAEWEYSARGGAGPDYGANDPYKGDIERHEVFATPGAGGHAREVATMPPNSLGFYDMLGNVREFVDGSYSVGGRVGGFLLKGGSYLSERQEIRSSARTEQPRTGKVARRPDAGFRVCISADVYTSLGQAEGVKQKLKLENENSMKTEANNVEAAKLEERLRQADASAAKAKEERERLTQEAAMDSKRKSLELAEKQANEENARLEELKKQLANTGPAPSENSTDPLVASGISSNTAAVGEPVQLTVTVRKARSADVPQTIPVNGLQINLAGRSTQFEMRNLKMSSILTYTYTVVPQVEGEFTIPSFDVQIEGKTFRTQAMKLSVTGGARLPQMPGQNNAPLPLPSGQPPASAETGEPFFADLILSKKKVFVGELVPVELRFYFNSRIGGQVGERPSFGVEGFTVQKFSNAVKREQVVNGTSYVVFSFQGAITAVKSGTLEIPEATLEARIQPPGKTPQSLGEAFKNVPPPEGMLTENRDVTIKTKPMRIEILPLPKDGHPEDFSGAVGKFAMEASVSPKKASGGEPVNLKVLVSGQGNFEGMGAPLLTGDEGWRSCPPTDKFRSTDAVGFAGEKTFEFPLIARQDQTRSPGLRFSYFDPSSEKYETLLVPPIAVLAKASSEPAGGNASKQENEKASEAAPASKNSSAIPTTEEVQVSSSLSGIQACGVDTLIVLDVSRSMLSEDFSIGATRASRLEVVKKMTEQLIRKCPNNRIGIVAFGGSPYLVSPLTQDRERLIKSLEGVQIGLVEDGTAIGSAIACAANHLKDTEAKERLIVLLTDGDNNAGKVMPRTAAEAAKALGIRIYTIGVGTNGEAPFPFTDPFGRKVYRNVPVDFNPNTIQDIAKIAGGIAYQATDTKSLEKIFDEIVKLEESKFDIKEPPIDRAKAADGEQEKSGEMTSLQARVMLRSLSSEEEKVSLEHTN